MDVLPEVEQRKSNTIFIVCYRTTYHCNDIHWVYNYSDVYIMQTGKYALISSEKSCDIYFYISKGCRFRSGHTTAWRVNKRILVILVAYIILRMPDAIQILSSVFYKYQACSAEQIQIFELTKVTLEVSRMYYNNISI